MNYPVIIPKNWHEFLKNTCIYGLAENWYTCVEMRWSDLYITITFNKTDHQVVSIDIHSQDGVESIYNDLTAFKKISEWLQVDQEIVDEWCNKHFLIKYEYSVSYSDEELRNKINKELGNCLFGRIK